MNGSRCSTHFAASAKLVTRERCYVSHELTILHQTKLHRYTCLLIARASRAWNTGLLCLLHQPGRKTNLCIASNIPCILHVVELRSQYRKVAWHQMVSVEIPGADNVRHIVPDKEAGLRLMNEWTVAVQAEQWISVARSPILTCWKVFFATPRINAPIHRAASLGRRFPITIVRVLQ